VDSFTGSAIDANGIGQVCRDNHVIFVLNASQGLGARVLDVHSVAVDALTCCGSKWLCGPYGTGFCWLTPSLRESLLPRHAYWLTMQSGASLDQKGGYSLRTDLGARAWDVFCPANFFNYIPWTASIEYLLQAGPDRVASYDQRLVTQIVQGLGEDIFQLVSPPKGCQRSTLVILRPKKAGKVESWNDKLTKLGVDTAAGVDSIRISPHLHNTSEDIARLIRVLSARS